jgi:hypothetical protein
MVSGKWAFLPQRGSPLLIAQERKRKKRAPKIWARSGTHRKSRQILKKL